MDFLYDESGNAYSFVYNGTQYYYVRNLQGDVVRILNTSGATVVAYSYDAWGKCTVTTGASNAIANANPIRYRGCYYDTDTGFYYLQSRYYDPSIMRFISTDSYINANGDLIGFNMYAYCGNNPIVRSDDGGTAFETVFDIVSLMASVAEFMAAPNPVTFLGMAADAIDLIPFVTGVGEVTRAARLTSKGLEVIDTVHDASKALDRTGDANERGFALQ
jgi:RHS repeat-associated protein